MQTINRRLRTVIGDTLREYGIDDLQIEIDLVSVVKAELNELFPDEPQPQGALEALKAHEDHAEEVFSVDTSGFPEDVADLISKICQMWMLLPPIRKKAGGEYARWIECARDIQEACSDMSVDTVMFHVYSEYSLKTAQNNGEVPFTVSGPCSLIKVCRAKAGQLRQGEHFDDKRNINKDEGESSFHF